MIDWHTIDTVILDMDGTLLDLQFDSYFWRQYVPLHYAQQHSLTVTAAKQRLEPLFLEHQGTLNWYCLDFWSRTLQLDIAALKRQIRQRIAVRPHALAFLDAVRNSQRRLILATNAHPDALTLKLREAPIATYFDTIVTAHSYAVPKENPQFWQRFTAQTAMTPATSLFIDDSLAIRRTAKAFGIQHVLAIAQPDSQSPPHTCSEFPTVHDYQDILPTAIFNHDR